MHEETAARNLARGLSNNRWHGTAVVTLAVMSFDVPAPAALSLSDNVAGITFVGAGRGLLIENRSFLWTGSRAIEPPS